MDDQSQQLDFSASDERAGFRLHQVEIFNWGTFDQKVWSLTAGGDNTLLTGDIGSGKSTLVDAVTTLLVPAQKIIYNKAAGAESKERSLKSYVLGYYKSERTEGSHAARAVALRDHNNYSVILGRFYNEGFDQWVTLAQVFWIKDNQGQPARFYVVSDVPLEITRHFAGFGKEINNLKKQLRKQANCQLFDSFPPYGAALRRRFGIDNAQALELFNQTVSMKAVGNLTDFVRHHMLEPFPVEDRIQNLIGHFDDLNRAHEAVLKAKHQISILQPLVDKADRHQAVERELAELHNCREALRPWFAKLKGELLLERLQRLEQDLGKLHSRIETLQQKQRGQRYQRDDIRQAIAENGGDRLERIKQQIEQKLVDKQARSERMDRYNAVAAQLELPRAESAETFVANSQAQSEQHALATQLQAQLQNSITDSSMLMRDLKQQHHKLDSELKALGNRRSNISHHGLLNIREQLCELLKVTESELPFAGELIQVHDNERDWEGAIERLLHNFALSLLVPDEHYPQVAEWVNDTHLRGRLVYYRITSMAAQASRTLHLHSLVRKLSLRTDSRFYTWIESELGRRFDYACCTDMIQFRREKQAMTITGQIKSGNQRHEKDDRHKLTDRTRYLLGWSNEAKISALKKALQDLEQQMGDCGAELAVLSRQQQDVSTRLQALSKLEEYTDFQQLNWRPLALEVDNLEQEREQLEAESDTLRLLQRQLSDIEEAISRSEQLLQSAREKHTQEELKQQMASAQLDDSKTLLEAMPEQAQVIYFPMLDAMMSEALGDRKLTVESCDNRHSEMRDWLQSKRIDKLSRKLGHLQEQIIRAMSAYSDAYPQETREADISIEAADEYRSMLEALQSDDLPKFEQRFKVLLNENTIREIANFHAQLNKEKQAIRERIARINSSLHDIDYNPNRYIILLAEDNPDQEIRTFQSELRACTEGALTGSQESQYTETKFLQVKQIVQRFKGREGSAGVDKSWTRKVTDVRNWFNFSASERWREDDAEYEHYSDSGGKSGGQKEKLAYTVLAASLAYQFGLEWGETRSRSFRFVVIDEAFGRGSDQSTRYGLELFKRLNLQLLIVTPLQKIHIIEPYVSSVGFVHSEEGKRSMLRNLTIEEYHKEKAARHKSPLPLGEG